MEAMGNANARPSIAFANYSVSMCEILKRKPGRIKGHEFHSHLSQVDKVRR